MYSIVDIPKLYDEIDDREPIPLGANEEIRGSYSDFESHGTKISMTS